MKVFVSSVIASFEAFRDAAADAARLLGHDVRRAEDFSARPESPQQTCLAGVRWADVVLLVLGPRYGAVQASGLSATHEEYVEARDRARVLAFIQRGVDFEELQRRFVDEVRRWESGVLTTDFTTPERLRDAVLRGLHDLALAERTGPVDDEEMLGRARRRLPYEHGRTSASLTVVVAGAPRQQILRPAQLESRELEALLSREALFGAEPIFDRSSGTRRSIRDDALVLEQDDRAILLDELGTVSMTQPAVRRDSRGQLGLHVLIEEDAAETIARGLRFAGWVLDEVDAPRRITDVVPVVALRRNHLGMLTRAEYERTPSSVPMSLGDENVEVTLNPPRRPRSAIRLDTLTLAEDLVVLLRRRAR